MNFQLSFDSAFATGTEIYISPFVRILPYILGAITAWLMVENQSKFDISDIKEKCLWNLALLLFFCCIYSTIKRDMCYLYSISLFVFGRFLFSLSVCWMIVGSATGRGSFWSRVLEAKVFQHVNRLSYAIYLLNPFVIAFFFSLTSVSTHADPFMLVSENNNLNVGMGFGIGKILVFADFMINFVSNIVMIIFFYSVSLHLVLRLLSIWLPLFFH